MKVALAQLNPVVGDVPGNTAKVRESIASAAALPADLVVFGELSTVGYPARDLLEDPALVADNVAALHSIARDCRGIAALVGFVRPAEGGGGPPLEDAAALLTDGEVRQVHVKALLPNHDVYDDPRYFRPGPGPTCWPPMRWAAGTFGPWPSAAAAKRRRWPTCADWPGPSGSIWTW